MVCKPILLPRFTGFSKYPGDPLGTLLYYGYLPRFNQEASELPWATCRRSVDAGETDPQELIDDGIRAFQRGFENIEGECHVIPLSGGLDSRAILAELLRRVEPERLLTVTVGTPGTFDFDFPAVIARRVGVRHQPIDLTQIKFQRDQLLETSLKNASPTWVFDAFYNRLIREAVGDGALYWSGFLGSRLTNSKHLPGEKPASWDAAVREFVRRNCWLTGRTVMKPGYDPASVLPKAPIHPDSDLDYYEQLDLTLRQMCLVAPVNLPAGFRHRVPFLERPWVEFILGAPSTVRKDQAFYRALLRDEYRDLFRLPTKNAVGLSLLPTCTEYVRYLISRTLGALKRQIKKSLPKPQINYIAFDSALRRQADFQQLVRQSLDALARCGNAPWLDCHQVWTEHMSGRKDHTQLLLHLTSVEIHMTAHGFESLSECAGVITVGAD